MVDNLELGPINLLVGANGSGKSNFLEVFSLLQRIRIGQLQESILEQFSSPEQINDSPQTAPSKRLIALHPRYDKVLFGVDACLAISLDTIRRECSTFDNWLTTLEQRVQEF